MSRVKVTFEMDVFDYPQRNPGTWDWSDILEDDGVDIPDWETLSVTPVSVTGTLALHATLPRTKYQVVETDEGWEVYADGAPYFT